MRYTIFPIILKCLIFKLFICGCHERMDDNEAHILSGKSMGTTWSLAFRDPPISISELEPIIQTILNEQESIFSLWNENSNLSKLNHSPSGVAVPVNAVMVELLAIAEGISKNSDGAYDITISPLVELWGYGPDGAPGSVIFPEAVNIAEALESVGMDKIEWSQERSTITRLSSGVELDFNSLAKGNCLDLVAARLEFLGFRHFMFELGGEVLARGHQTGELGGWPVGIQSPDGISGHLSGTIRLIDSVLATSGTYYQRSEAGRVSTTHVIDPRNGYPVKHSTVSVSVIADRGAYADAWATALLVLGAEMGRPLAERLGIRAIFISN